MQNRCHVGEQVEDLPLRPTLWNLSLRKLLSLSLNNPLCQALSKAFAMSKKLTFMAIDGIWSKPALILWTIDVSWFSQESFGRKPDRAGETIFFFQKQKNLIKYNYFKNFGISWKKWNWEIVHCLSPSLWTETMFDFFDIFENTLHWLQFLNINDNGCTISALNIFKNLTEISLWP